MKHLKEFRKGDPWPGAERLNEIIRAINSLMNLRVASPLQMQERAGMMLLSIRGQVDPFGWCKLTEALKAGDKATATLLKPALVASTDSLAGKLKTVDDPASITVYDAKIDGGSSSDQMIPDGYELPSATMVFFIVDPTTGFRFAVSANACAVPQT